MNKRLNPRTMMWEAPGEKPVPDEIIQTGSIKALMLFIFGEKLIDWAVAAYASQEKP